jgi:hypothetical protein
MCPSDKFEFETPGIERRKSVSSLDLGQGITSRREDVNKENANLIFFLFNNNATIKTKFVVVTSSNQNKCANFDRKR